MALGFFHIFYIYINSALAGPFAQEQRLFHSLDLRCLLALGTQVSNMFFVITNLGHRQALLTSLVGHLGTFFGPRIPKLKIFPLDIFPMHPDMPVASGSQGVCGEAKVRHIWAKKRPELVVPQCPDEFQVGQLT